MPAQASAEIGRFGYVNLEQGLWANQVLFKVVINANFLKLGPRMRCQLVAYAFLGAFRFAANGDLTVFEA